jgi:hypothetical protein
MADDFTIKKGDVLPALNATLIPATGQSFTLSGASVLFRMWAKSQAVDKVSRTCTVVDVNARTVRVDWQAGDTDTAEGYLGQFVVTFPGGNVQTFPNGSSLVIRVTP